jgi:arylformamidase
MLVDLSHTIEDGMPGFVMRAADGRAVPLSASIRPFLTHEQSRPFYDGKASFEVTEMSFQTSIGTYIDSPRHRFQGRRDIAQLSLDELVLEGVLVYVPNALGGESIGLGRMRMPDEIGGKAVLFRFDWDKHWGTEAYSTYPHIGQDVIDCLVAGGAKLVGVDTLNVDDSTNPERPCHTHLLGNDILIAENLTNLAVLPAFGFRFFAIPIKAKDAAAMTIRAFAEVLTK